jgi:hypothetical protein
MQGETKPASAVRLFTSQFNSTKCAAADILRALCTPQPHSAIASTATKMSSTDADASVSGSVELMPCALCHRHVRPPRYAIIPPDFLVTFFGPCSACLPALSFVLSFLANASSLLSKPGVLRIMNSITWIYSSICRIRNASSPESRTVLNTMPV